MHLKNDAQKHSKRGQYTLLFVVVLFACIAVVLWTEIRKVQGNELLTVTFFDVGQGDAIHVETPNGTQVLIDAGKGRMVLRELGKVQSFFDRQIDMAVATHPDLDHIGGLPEVFARYTIERFLYSNVEDDGADNVALGLAVQREGVREIIASPQTGFILDEDIYLEVLFPDRDVSKVEVNVGSVVLRLVYKDTSFLFTGDAPAGIETYLVSLYGTNLKSDVLKLGHHGSKTASSFQFLGYVNPEYAVISAGCENSYGHPHQEVLDRLKRLDIEEVSTCTEGTIMFQSNGKEVELKR